MSEIKQLFYNSLLNLIVKREPTASSRQFSSNVVRVLIALLLVRQLFQLIQHFNELMEYLEQAINKAKIIIETFVY